jgi:hypothetical protein
MVSEVPGVCKKCFIQKLKAAVRGILVRACIGSVSVMSVMALVVDKCDGFLY